MYKQRKPGAMDERENTQLYVEMDPTERYGRFNDVLGKGAMKVVYRAFDEFLGTEVAWNQVKLNEVFKSPEELQRLYCEVHLLKNLNHSSIMRFRTSWTNVDRLTFNFITEMFSSGTLREYRSRYKRVNVRALKDWARQILEGLEYMHGHDPPVIHRDLKCDNIFVNGHLGQVKIGDLGLAAILRGSQHAHSVIGTPEFMAPELYEEEYDELVDIYSFGMCVLEMLTGEYPYSECSNPAQIYKKVTLGKLPAAFYRIDDVESRRFIGRCLEKAPNRPSARELLMDPFLSVEEVEEVEEVITAKVSLQKASLIGKSPELQAPARRTNMKITGTMDSEEDTIFLKVQICDQNDTSGARNIYFPFDITGDTSLDVATEMVKELDITDWKPFQIANMIDDEISNLVPSWKVSMSSSQIHQQHSFNYAEVDDDDNNSFHHPFYSTSSFSSSQASLSGLFTSQNMQTFQGNSLQHWLQAPSSDTEDASSQSSNGPDIHSDVKYFCQRNEFDLPSSCMQEEPHCITKASKCTRFDPDRNVSKNRSHSDPLDPYCRPHQKLTMTASFVDLRSKLLHQKLVNEVNKRRLFKTVGSVEHIGYHDPRDFSCVKITPTGRSGEF